MLLRKIITRYNILTLVLVCLIGMGQAIDARSNNHDPLVMIPPHPPEWKNKWKDYSKVKNCLIRNVFYESPRVNPNTSDEEYEKILEDRIKVINVTLNRVKSDHYPDNVCSVVYQYRQFSWTLESSKKSTPISVRYKHNQTELSNLSEITKIVEYAMKNGLKDLTQGSLYYHTHWSNPYWKDSKTYTVASNWHYFYK